MKLINWPERDTDWKKYKALIIAAAVILSIATATNPNPVDLNRLPAAPAPAEAANNLDVLRNFNGKYSFDVKLLEKTEFSQRLKTLLGDERYTFLKTHWNVVSPMEVVNDVFVAKACQKHNCHDTNFIIVYDFQKNVMYAGIREESKVSRYSESGEHSPAVMDWADNN
jgi:hypothetical protein